MTGAFNVLTDISQFKHHITYFSKGEYREINWPKLSPSLFSYTSHGAQSDVGIREGWHENKAECGKSGGKITTEY